LSQTILPVNRDLLADKKQVAEQLRRQFTQQGTLVVNMVSSPGAGKTTLLQETARHWANRYQMAVLVGDLATDRDAERLRPFVPVEQLTTGGACHLEIPLVKQGLGRLPERRWDFLFIENIGNLVCPAAHDLGEHLRVVVLSTTEGDDKPGKYPKMFRSSHALVISKCDLLPYVPFSVEAAIADACAIQPDLISLAVSSLNGNGVAAWCEFLEQSRSRMLQRIEAPS
jgi:hydrogenase nickel incorporation protein HypB